ncbi:MAG: fatty acyl-AMP ligase [Candidatus Hydrogenedentes bacterium]|nr:fatty acyl-AMP ligase [Candidatus Hydrogenedentota bacterium]
MTRANQARVEAAIDEATPLDAWAEFGRTLVELLQNRAAESPDKLAFTFLVDGEEEGDRYTYADLDRRARAIAVALRDLCEPGDRVLLLYPPGLDYLAAFFGCLYAGVAAVPVYPPDPGRLNRSLPRLKVVIRDADTRVALTVSLMKEMGAAFTEHDAEFEKMVWLATDTIPDEHAEDWIEPELTPETLAFLQYTSGSTADPKGVMVSHKNLLYNLYDMGHYWGSADNSVFVTWLPVFHDMGLIFGLLLPIFLEFPCYLMSPLAFLQRPLRWLRAMSKYGATHTCAPNFAYDLCVRKTTPEQRAALDLSNWQCAGNGAEPIRPETLDRFTETFQSCGFQGTAFSPGYGLAEATLKVTTTPRDEPPTFLPVVAEELERHRVVAAQRAGEGVRIVVGCGRTHADTRVLIVDPDSRLQCGPDTVGEIWVSGTTVAQGYWNRPEDTATTFEARLADTDEGPFLRTGDLGFVKDGIVFVTGRIKDMIIIDGQNHYPQDIERTVELSHEAIRPGCCAAFSVHVDGEERLALVAEAALAQGVEAKPLIGLIRRAISEVHNLRAHKVCLIRPRTIDKTSSGKIQRQSTRKGFLTNSLEVLAVE